MNNRIKITKKFIYISALVFIVLFSVGYSALSQTLNIGGSTRYNKKYPVRVTGITLQGTSNDGIESFSPSYTWNTTTTGVNLPNLNSTVTYTVTVRNYGSESQGISLSIYGNSNDNMTYETSNMPSNNMIPGNSTVTFNVTIKYGVSTLPGTKTDSMTIKYTFAHVGAMFKTGKEVVTKMKQFININATYGSTDTTITNIARYTASPNSSYLIDDNIVSVQDYMTPIYMWYDSANTTIYWYSEAADVYYNPDSSCFYYELKGLNSISCMNDISSEYVTSMRFMFYDTGYNSLTFTLDLGDKFDTSNVTKMDSMFSNIGYNSLSFTLELGDNFDTINVIDMSYMFENTGHNSTNFTLDLGDLFDTSSVTNMYRMFCYTGYNSTAFTLDLGSLFDTSSVTNMFYMFSYTGYNSTVFTLDLGSLFDTSSVTDMQYMFDSTGYKSTVFTLDLGNKFDTSNVTNMAGMFQYAGYSSPVYTLNLGSNFNTSNVRGMGGMFQYAGYSSLVFTLDLGSYFDTSNVISMAAMFQNTGYSNPSFTLDLGSNFDTSKVTGMQYMFRYIGYNSTVFTLNLGPNFDTSNVTTMYQMFHYVSYRNPSFQLDLGAKFDTSNVTTMFQMFTYFKGTTIYAPTTFVTTAVTSSTDMFVGCSNLIGGMGTVYDVSHTNSLYAHIDGGTSNPGYFTAKGAKYATFYYNSNTSSGGLTVNQISTYCIPTSGTSCTVTIPSEVTSSMGKYNSPYKGVSTSTGNMNSSSLTISDNTTFYANYSKQVTNYYYNSGYTSRVIYRNEYFTSTSAMESRLATSNTSISNYSTAVGPGSSVWTGLSTGADTTTEYTSVQAAANSNTANLYTVYTFNVTYAKGANVSSNGATSGSCTVTSSNTSCSVTLPSITPTSGFTSVGWSTTNGATSGTAAGASYTLSSNGSTLYANAVKYYTCPVSREPETYNFGGYQTSRYGSYQSACQSRTGANSECGQSQSGTYDTCNWTPRCPDEGSCYDVYDGNGNRTMTCCTCPNYVTNTCTSYSCPNSVATWSYMYGEPQTAPYGDYQDQCV